MTPRPVFVFLLASAGACATATSGARFNPVPPALPFATETLLAEQVRRGVTYWYIRSASGPWAIHVLDVDRSACYSAVAVKGAKGAVGRATTSALLARLDSSFDVVGGVNADFFFFTPPGLPTNAHVSGGRLLSGPNAHPVIAFDSAGVPRITTLRVTGTVALGARAFPIDAWNRRAPDSVSLVDANWGGATDTASGTLELVLDRDRRLVQVDTARTGVDIPDGGSVIIASGLVGESMRFAATSLRVGALVDARVSLAPHPMEAVGGRPVLVRDSVVTAPASNVRHPRTAVGIGRKGTRLLLVVVDGRQAPHSDGMTLRELADVMLALGARDALNLDGGGSSAMVLADPAAGGALRLVNRPSDTAGERPVGNALAIVSRCH
ncbi:MAG: phosphodiester glycosidase family protein [Gemmatimonadaceae bacterium]